MLSEAHARNTYSQDEGISQDSTVCPHFNIQILIQSSNLGQFDTLTEGSLVTLVNGFMQVILTVSNSIKEKNPKENARACLLAVGEKSLE